MSTATKDIFLLNKFKDGIQETVVFLRTLEQFKIPAVMETRRKKLLEKLLLLQGDTIRETPPSYEDDGPTSPKREIGELKRESSNIVDKKVNEYVRIESKAKEEMAHISPKKATTFAKAPEEKPPAQEEASEYLEPAAAGVQLRAKKTDETTETAERPVSAASSVDSKTEQVDDASPAAAAATGKDKKKRFGSGGRGLKVFKNIKLGKSKKSSSASTSVIQQNGEAATGEPAPETEDMASVTTGKDGETKGEGEAAGKEAEKKEEEKEAEVVEEVLEEGVTIQSELEKRVAKKIGKGFNWAKISGKVKGTTLVMTAGSKGKELELAGCMVSPSDAAENGIELFSHGEQKQWVFRVGSKELRERWIEELQKAIDECPVETATVPESTEAGPVEEESGEKPGEEVPEIKIDPVTTSDEDTTSPKKKRISVAAATASPSRANKTKPVNEIPEQGVQIKGYLHRKKGTFGGWERAYAVVTYTAIYFTTGEDIREYHHVCPLEGLGTVKMEKKGHDKQSEGILVRSGKNKETLSLPSGDMSSWKQVIEEVLGVSQVTLELGSEDEDEAADAPPTPIPVTKATTAAPPMDDLALYEELPAGEEIEEDIYEEFDDIRPSPTRSPAPAAPSLPPPRQDQRVASPTLPPRNELNRASMAVEPTPFLPPRASPSLPPRNSPLPSTKLPKKGAAAKTPAAPPPRQDSGPEELYEDVVGPPPGTGANDEVEELYEDVVNPPAGTRAEEEEGGEELYEDVVAPPARPEPMTPTEEYTEMSLGGAGGPTEEYVVMERPEDEDIEVYDEVDPNSPQHAPINSLPLKNPAPKSPPATTGAGKIVKPPPPATYVPKHSGNLSHKPPKKSKFYEEWCAVEGTNLCTYKNQKDKKLVEKISLNEFDMIYTPGRDGKFAIRLTKGDKIHHFTLGSKGELTSWVGAMRELSKSTTLELPSGEAEIYETTTDHAAESDEQITFKAGSYIRIISRGSSDYWIGQLGSTSEVFTGSIGKFPASKVTLAEDLYI